MTTRYKATVSCDGTQYSGWQLQPKHITIQGELEKALYELVRDHVRVNCSGRTDRGVHTRGQVIHFDLKTVLWAGKLALGMNAVLPEDIRILSVKKVSSDFDSRKSAIGKEYRYFIWNDKVVPPYLRFTRTLVRPPLDVKLMNKAAHLLVGEHDFAAFSANPRREVGGTVRHLNKLRVLKKGHELIIIAQADGFLYKMVRSLAGFLIRVGSQELAPETALEILASKERTAQVPTALPQGLFLWKVFY